MSAAAFTCIPNSVVLNAALSPTAHWLYEVLKLHDNKKQGCFPGQDTLAKEMMLGIATIQRALRELVGAQIIERVRRGRARTNEYRFLNDASPVINQGDDQSPMMYQESVDTSNMRSHKLDDPSPVMAVDPSPVMAPSNKTKVNNTSNESITPNVVIDVGSPLAQTPVPVKTEQAKNEIPKPTPYHFVVEFYKAINVPAPKDKGEIARACKHAKTLINKGVIEDFIPSMIEFCSWADSVDLGILVSQAEKWRIAQLRPEQEKTDKKLHDKNGKPNLRWIVEYAKEAERQGL